MNDCYEVKENGRIVLKEKCRECPYAHINTTDDIFTCTKDEICQGENK